MSKIRAPLLGVLLSIFAGLAPAIAQSAPGWTYGYVPTVAQWNAAFAGKQDVLAAPPLLTTGGQMTGELVTAASSASRAGLNLIPGAAPSSPNNGDLWTTTSSIFARINGVTVDLINGACPTCAVTNATNTFTASQIISLNATLPAAQTGTLLQLNQADGTAGRVEIDTYAASAILSGVRANGTAASPTALALDDLVLSLSAWGYDGSTRSGPAASVRLYAGAAWTTTNHATYLDFATTDATDATKTLTSRMRVENNGGVTLNGSPSGGIGSIFSTVNVNTSATFQITNVNTGTAALTGFVAVNSVGSATLGIGGTSYAGQSGFLANKAFVFSGSGTAGIAVYATGANPIDFYVNNVRTGGFTSGGAFQVGTGTLAIAAGKTLTASNTLTFTGTDSSSVNFGAGGTVLYGNQTITLSGDVSGSGTTAITTAVAKVNGVAYGTSPATNTVPVVTSSNAVTYETVPNAALANSTISGVALGGTLGTLTFGTHLASGGASYNGSAGVTITSDATAANTASTIMLRDGSGQVAATTFTGALAGTATNATNSAITDDTATAAAMNLAWVTTNTGNLPLKVSSTKLTFNPGTSALNQTGNQNASTVHSLLNTSTGVSALAGMVASNASNAATFGIGGTGYTGFASLQNKAFIYSSTGASGIELYADGANPIDFYVNGSRAGGYTSGGLLTLGTPLAVAQGGTACAAASITCFNNITGFSAAGTTGTTSTNLVFSTAPAITGGQISSLTVFSLRDTSAAFDLTFTATSSPALTAGRTLTFNIQNVSETISLNGSLTLGSNFVTSGAFGLTLTQTGTTNVTLPTTGTLATLAGAETLTNKVSISSAIYTGPGAVTFQSNGSTLAATITTGQKIGFGLETNPQALFVASSNTTTGIAAPNGTIAAFNGIDATNANFAIQSFGAVNPAIFMRAAQGTAASKTASQSGDVLGFYSATGYAASAYDTAQQSGFYVGAGENHTLTANGTFLAFLVVNNTTTTRVEGMRLLGSGALNVGNTSDFGAGTINANTGYYAGGTKGVTCSGALTVISSITIKDGIITAATGTGGTCS